MNKKGQYIKALFGMIFIFMIIVLCLGMGIIFFGNIDSALSQNVTVGQNNLSLNDVNNNTFGQINDGFVDNADFIGISIIFAMIFFMLMNAYFFGDQNHKLFIIIDIALLVGVFVMSIYVSQVYSTFINSSSLFDVYGDSLPKSSSFILNLPLYVTAIGIFVMILSYAGIRLGNKQGVEPNVLGY